MKTIPFIKFSLCLFVVIGSYAQESKIFKESFNVNKDVEVLLNTDNAEIIIETWNKNRVDVEVEVTVDIEDKELAKEILEKFNFEALGNSSKVEIKTGRKGRFLTSSNVHYFPEEEVEIITDAIRDNIPPPPPLPPMPELPELPEMDFNIQFDMDRFNEEGRAYIVKFRDEVKDIVNDSVFKKEMKEWKIKFKEEMKNCGLGDSIRVYSYELRNNLRPALQEMRTKLRNMRGMHKVKKKITIKMPKDAKLDLDVKRSQLKIADLNQIDANLNYSGLQINKLRGDNCSIQAAYSDVNILDANALNLNIKYAKNVVIGNVVDLVSVSKTSNLKINNIVNKADIEGSFGELMIGNINDNFTFININLKNSKAKLNLPDIAYNFYINSRASNIDFKTKLDYSINEAFDTKIYQNKKPVSNAKTLNIKADYSTFQVY